MPMSKYIFKNFHKYMCLILFRSSDCIHDEIITANDVRATQLLNTKHKHHAGCFVLLHREHNEYSWNLDADLWVGYRVFVNQYHSIVLPQPSLI